MLSKYTKTVQIGSFGGNLPPAAHGRQGEATSGRFVEVRFTKAEFSGMAALEKADGPDWVAKRPTPLRVHRRKAVSGIPTPESGQSSLSAPDPLQPDDR